MDEGRLSIVELEGHNYYVVDQDLSKGDRRSDGPAMATFFNVEAGSTMHNNVRESCRLKKRSEINFRCRNWKAGRTWQCRISIQERSTRSITKVETPNKARGISLILNETSSSSWSINNNLRRSDWKWAWFT